MQKNREPPSLMPKVEQDGDAAVQDDLLPEDDSFELDRLLVDFNRSYNRNLVILAIAALIGWRLFIVPGDDGSHWVRSFTFSCNFEKLPEQELSRRR